MISVNYIQCIQYPVFKVSLEFQGVNPTLDRVRCGIHVARVQHLDMRSVY